MSDNYQALIPEIRKRIKEEFQLENTSDTRDLLGLPYPYIASGKNYRQALFYWDTFFVNMALLKFKMVEEARHNVENLVYLYRKLNFIPTSNHLNLIEHFHPPLLPWMIRDIYRATGDKEWLRRVLPDAIKEFNFWVTKPHSSPTGLYRYSMQDLHNFTPETEANTIHQNLICSLRFNNIEGVNPVDLNAILYRNAKLLYDLQIEDSGQGDEMLLQKSAHIKKLLELCWDEEDQFYYDNDFDNKKLVKIKSLSGFFPLFVEMVDKSRAEVMIQQLSNFTNPGGLSYTDKDYSKSIPGLKYPLITAPCMYFIIKGMCDYDYMEDAADIGGRWLKMVQDTYQSTGQLWEWYNSENKSVKNENDIPNTPVLGWTAGTYVALIDTLGLS